MDQLKFKNRWYSFEKRVETQLSVEYVPDWDLFKAIRESVQNMVDEHTLTGANITWFQDGEGAYFYDSGSGVDFSDILYLGVSGKRGLDNMVGQHGEGEVVSFLVAARLGAVKIMASKDWLCQGAIENVGGHKVLVLNVYKTNKPRKGTCWRYSRGWNDFCKAKASFMQVGRGRKRKILRDEPGVLYTRGMRVGKLDYLALGYNLTLTPGRDRAGFTWEQVGDEVKEILENHATPEDLAVILKDAIYWTPLEMKIKDLVIAPKLTAKAAQIMSGKKVVWAEKHQAAQIADATERGDTKILNTYGGIPAWVRDGLPNVISVVTMNEELVLKDPPQVLAAVLDNFKKCLHENHRAWNVKCTHSFKDKKVLAYADGSTIVLSKSAVKNMDFETFVGVMAHEIAHIETGAADCTRQHERRVRDILTNLVARMLMGNVREHLVTAGKVFIQYTSS